MPDDSPAPAELDLEAFKINTEYLRHLTTLSTGSIVLIATFLEKLFAKPVWTGAVIVAVAGFMLSVFAASFAYSLGIMFENPVRRASKPEWVRTVGGMLVLLTWLGFLTGTIGLGAFTIRNLATGSGP